jgi:hypothetical protein
LVSLESKKQKNIFCGHTPNADSKGNLVNIPELDGWTERSWLFYLFLPFWLLIFLRNFLFPKGEKKFFLKVFCLFDRKRESFNAALNRR